jgi:hypothetical protein
MAEVHGRQGTVLMVALMGNPQLIRARSVRPSSLFSSRCVLRSFVNTWVDRRQIRRETESPPLLQNT